MFRRAFLLILIIGAPFVAGAPEHEAAVLGATISGVFPVDLSVYDTRWEPASPQDTGCHAPGVFSFADNGFRFQEEREEAGCGEILVPVRLPVSAEFVTVKFTSTRSISQASQVDELQLAGQAIQSFRVFNSAGVFVQGHDIYTNFHPDDPESRPQEFLVNSANLGRSFTLAWYFEDVGNAAAPVAGAATGRGFQATVRDIEIVVPPTPVEHLVDASYIISETERERVEGVPATMEINGDWLPGNPVVRLEYLDSIQFHNVTSWRGEPVTTQVELGTGINVVTFSPTIEGRHHIQFSGVTPLVVAPEPGPTTFIPLVYWLLAIPGIILIGTTRSVDIYRRTHHPRQKSSMVGEIIVLGIILASYVATLLFILSFDHVTPMGTLPFGTLAWIMYAALFAVFGAANGLWAQSAAQRKRAQAMHHEDETTAKNLALTRSNRDLEQFAYVASHDLQEPLRKVSTFTNLLKKRYGTQLDERATSYITSADAAAERARGLIRDLLAFSKVGQGANMRVVSLNDVLKDALETLNDTISATGAQVRFGNMPNVYGSASLLEQLLVNLIGNGIKYQPPGQTPEVHVTAKMHGDVCRLRVKDNGIGIARKHHEKVFQLFGRLHARGGDFDGSGIGLAICTRIAEFHGGTISVTSAPGKGSTFSVDLPVKDAMVGGHVE